jgi:hypothetical protein
MRAYMQALLEVSGLLAGKAFDLKSMLGNFKTHLDEGRFERTDDGRVLLTDIGRSYFSGRLTDQKVSREEVLAMIRNIASLQPIQGWERVEVDLP